MTGLQTMQNFVLLDLKDDFFSMLFHPFYLLPQILELDLSRQDFLFVQGIEIFTA